MTTEPGYLSPSVAVATSMPKRGVGAAVLIVPVVSTGEEDRPGAVVASAEPFLRADTVAEIEAGLRALDATGASDQVHRLAVPSLPVGSVLTVGLGKPRREWPADTIRCAAGVAARALNSSEAVITTLAELPGDGICSATVEGLILGSYRFSAFRSDKTAPKDAGLRKITVLCCAKDAKKRALHGAAVATAVATARDLVNTPPSHLFPAEFAKRAKTLSESVGLDVEVIDEKALIEGRLWRGDWCRPGLVAAAATGAVDSSGIAAGQEPPKGQEGGLGWQGDHLRYRRHLDQAGSVDAPHDLGHGRSGRGDRHCHAGCPAATAD